MSIRGHPRIGEEVINTNNEKVKVIEYFSASNITIEFEDGTITKNRTWTQFKSGKLNNPNTKYIAKGKYNSNQLDLICRRTWKSMFNRCYGVVILPTYIGCTVSEDWHDYLNFKDWFISNYKEDFELDKDLIIEGNKIYSKDTCCFVPLLINATLSIKPNGNLPYGVKIEQYKGKISYVVRISIRGKREYLGVYKSETEAGNVYKRRRSEYLKELAEEYKDQIIPKAYEALIRLSGNSSAVHTELTQENINK